MEAKTSVGLKKVPGVAQGPKPGKATEPKCVCLPVTQMISIPGKMAIGPGPAGKWVDVEGTIYDILCKGKSKGAIPLGPACPLVPMCGPAGKAKGACNIACDVVTWDANWSTMAECQKVKYKIYYPAGAEGKSEGPISVDCKLVPVQPKCPF
jgi:hypothetical protein